MGFFVYYLLLRNNHFFRDGTIFAVGNEEVDAVSTTFHAVSHGTGFGIVCLELIDEMACHVVHLHFNLARETLEIECHRAVIRIGDYVEGSGTNGRAVIFNAIE